MKKDHYPIFLSLVLILIVMGFVLAKADYDPLVFAEIGTRFSENDPLGNEGYDGQFIYYIAQDISPETVAPHLDTPAYRYQRILLPLLARIISFGQQNFVALAIPLILIISHMVGVWAVSQLLISWGRNPWLSLVYALWLGILLSIRLDLPEPLAYGLVAVALLAQEKDKKALSWLLYGLALFAKEVVIIFVIAQLIYDFTQKRWKDIAGMSLLTLLPFLVFQFWLYQSFGNFGIGSGGAMATGFEWIPFMGIYRISEYSLGFFAAIIAIYAPAIILPVLWGIWKTINIWRKDGIDLIALGLLLNAISILFLPFSTFREPYASFRLISGLILSLLLFTAKFRQERVLRYSYLYLVLNLFITKM